MQALVQQGTLTPAPSQEMLPLLGHLLAARFGTDLDERLAHAGPEQIKHQTFLALHDIVVALAKGQPVILVLEDMHWADSFSLDVLSLLMDALRLAPLFLLCVYRPEREHKCWHLGTIAARKCPERYTELHLRELTPQQSRRLVESLLHIEALPASVKEQILARAQGNPFFVEEAMRSLIDAGLVYHDGEAWRARELAAAVRVADEAVAYARAKSDRLNLVEALRVQALVTIRQHQWVAAERSLEEGLALAQSMRYPYAEARLLHVYGAMHAQKGEQEAARDRLKAALAIFQRLGACKDIERVEQAIAEALGEAPDA